MKIGKRMRLPPDESGFNQKRLYNGLKKCQVRAGLCPPSLSGNISNNFSDWSGAGVFFQGCPNGDLLGKTGPNRDPLLREWVPVWPGKVPPTAGLWWTTLKKDPQPGHSKRLRLLADFSFAQLMMVGQGKAMGLVTDFFQKK